MIVATLRDLQWRARRFVIAGLGASMVFALTLVLAGLQSSFSTESVRVVDSVGADSWLVQKGVESVFSTVSLVPDARATEVKGVVRADPIAVSHHSIRFGRQLLDVSLIGYAPGGLGTPELVEGRLPIKDGELVADRALGARIGKGFVLAGKPFQVVGRTSRLTMNAGQAVLFARLQDVHTLLTHGQPVSSAIVTKGVPTAVPAGLALRSKEQTRQDLLRPLVGAIASIKAMLVLLWVVAAMVIGSVVYLSALERRRDFAVYKATGWSTRSLAVGLASQAILLSTTASLLGVVLAQLMLPLFPMNFEVPTLARELLPVVGLLVGLLASAAGLRKAVGVEPALAFGGP
ncbi:MAG TPA: ABC transporter permease [Mycobacteriales bacterium]|nr:ABC transporter permease [Mycobacteriales bacterium]